MYSSTYSDVPVDNVIFRWLSALSPAFLLTLALIALMVKLVVVDMEAPEEEAPVNIEFPVYKEDPLTTKINIKPVKKPEIEHPPELPDADPHITKNDINIPTFSAPIKSSPNFNIGFSGMPVPNFLAAAKYPTVAIRRGLEGYVDVNFDISTAGTTENIRIISAQPEGVFEKSAVAAVKRWRYQPKMEKGEPVAYKGMAQRIRFVMDGSKDT